MLSPVNKRKLRSIGHTLSSSIQIGKGGLSDNLMETISSDLEAHELVKVSLLKTCEMDVREAAIMCASATGSEIVHIIGRTFLLYKKSKEDRLGMGK